MISMNLIQQHFNKLSFEPESTNQTEAYQHEELNVTDDPDLNKPFYHPINYKKILKNT